MLIYSIHSVTHFIIIILQIKHTIEMKQYLGIINEKARNHSHGHIENGDNNLNSKQKPRAENQAKIFFDFELITYKPLLVLV